MRKLRELRGLGSSGRVNSVWFQGPCSVPVWLKEAGQWTVTGLSLRQWQIASKCTIMQTYLHGAYFAMKRNVSWTENSVLREVLDSQPPSSSTPYWELITKSCGWHLPVGGLREAWPPHGAPRSSLSLTQRLPMKRLFISGSSFYAQEVSVCTTDEENIEVFLGFFWWNPAFQSHQEKLFFFLNSPHFWNFHEALSSRKLFLLVSWLCFYSPISKVELCKLFLSYILASQPEAVTALKILWHRGLSLCALTSPVTLVHSPSENTECSLLPSSDRPLTHTHANTWTSTQWSERFAPSFGYSVRPFYVLETVLRVDD